MLVLPRTREIHMIGSEGASSFHEPVLSSEVLHWMDPSGSGLYLDGTVGGGGHAGLLLASCRRCRVIAVDRDPEALAVAESTLVFAGDRVRFIHARFDEVLDASNELESLDGALLDLGVSSHQLDTEVRGFSFRRGVNLDMRMGGDEEGIPSAGQLLNEGTEEDLTRIFREYGEEPRARRLVREIVSRRSRGPFRISDDLVAALYRALGRPPTVKDKARVFQGLRIAVNSELEALERVLPAIRDAMVPGAPFLVISYHSLEDRRVKNAFREWSRSCVCPPRIPLCQCRGKPLGSILTRTPIRPSEAEVDNNRRARSARLRVWRKS